MRINFELSDLRVFLAVFDLGSFHKAAEQLGMSQPALSRRLQALEGMIGASLFERTTRRVGPTAIGLSFAPMARRLLHEIEDGLLGLTGVGAQQGGLVTLACIPTAAFYFLPRAIDRFHALYPRIRFRILDLSSNDGLLAVSRGEADFGINLAGNSETDLEFTPLIDDPFVLACRRDQPLASRAQLGWKELEGETLVGVSRASGNRVILETALANLGIRLEFQYEVNHLTTSLGLVERGLGAAILPKLATPPDGHPLIVSCALGDPPVSRTIGLVERRKARLSPAAQRFRDMIVETWHL